MTFKLTKAQAKELDALAAAFEAAKIALYEKLDEIANDWESDFSDKSEKWQEGDAGSAVQERIDLIRSWADELPPEGEPAVDSGSIA
jgi:hypothetical protein